jgi:hypothetical protein
LLCHECWADAPTSSLEPSLEFATIACSLTSG